MLGWNAMLVGRLALTVPFASEDVTVKTELAHISCQPKGEVVVYF